MDAAGDLFIVDYSTTVVREVNHATGLITTIAGNGTAGYSGDNGQATAAELNGPNGIAVDAAGDLFIADKGNGRIREVNHATGLITTVAGNGRLAAAAIMARPPPPNCTTPKVSQWTRLGTSSSPTYATTGSAR